MPCGSTAIADASGLDLVGVQGHPYNDGFTDTLALIAWLAARTSHVHLFPNVANLPLRPPAILAKQAATIDVLSAGLRAAAPRCPASFRSMPTASNSSQKWAHGPPRLGSGHVVIDDGLGGQPVELGEFRMELTGLVLPQAGELNVWWVIAVSMRKRASAGFRLSHSVRSMPGSCLRRGRYGSLQPTGHFRPARALSKGWLRLWHRASRLAPVGAWCWLYFRPSS